MIWAVDGYWKDDKFEFTGYLITDAIPEAVSDRDDENIFFYVDDEKELRTFMSENGPADFIITSYEVVNDNRNQQV